MPLNSAVNLPAAPGQATSQPRTVPSASPHCGHSHARWYVQCHAGTSEKMPAKSCLSTTTLGPQGVADQGEDIQAPLATQHLLGKGKACVGAGKTPRAATAPRPREKTLASPLQTDLPPSWALGVHLSKSCLPLGGDPFCRAQVELTTLPPASPLGIPPPGEEQNRRSDGQGSSPSLALRCAAGGTFPHVPLPQLSVSPASSSA